MAIKKSELIQWLNTLEEDAFVYIDDGGLALKTNEVEAYIEIGGNPEEDEMWLHEHGVIDDWYENEEAEED